MNNEGLKQVLQNKVNSAIARNAEPAMRQMQALIKQETNIRDRLVPSSAIVFGADDEKSKSMLSYMTGSDEGESYYMHKNAVQQLASKTGIPSKFLTDLVLGNEAWQRKLGCKVLGDHIEHDKPQKFFIRTVQGEARAVMSEKYKPINAAPVFAAFKQEAGKHGAIMFDAHLSDLKAYMEVINPELIEVATPNNGTIWIAYGMRISSSDFGAGALSVRTMFWQGMCMNGAVGSRELHAVHLGKRLTDEDFNFSSETIRKSTDAMVSAVRDVARVTMHANNKQVIVNNIMKASSKEVDLTEEVKLLPKMGWTKEEADLIHTELMNNNPEHGLFGAPTKFKMQQAMTWVANGLEPERQREVQEMAGEYILN